MAYNKLMTDRQREILFAIIEEYAELATPVGSVALAKLFDVTTETIRGDLEKLEKQGVLVRTYGGATLAEGSDSDMPISDRDVINFEGKQRIGIAAFNTLVLAMPLINYRSAFTVIESIGAGLGAGLAYIIAVLIIPSGPSY